MNTRTPRHLLAKPRIASQKSEVEHKLHALRNNARLAIHMNEFYTSNPYVFSYDTWKSFNEHPEAIRQQLLEETTDDGRTSIPIHSMSLLPWRDASITPYNAKREPIGTYGYLFNLTQENIAAPPVVIAAGQESLLSSGELFRKNPTNAKHGICSDLYHDLFGKQGWIRTMAELSPAVTNLQLDRLAQFYSDNYTPNAAPHSYVCNEILVAAAKQHIEAIAIPAFGEFHKNATYRSKIELLGAMVGLQHLDRKIDLPVVLYHIHGAPDCGRGECSYLGASRSEFVTVALKALGDLQDTWKADNEYQNFRETIEKVLHLDITKPLDQQTEQVLALRRSCQEAKAFVSAKGGLV